ncbi:MAG: hypothetical protein SV775_13070, partial [Thermodesulfobacteriota bacterium]|nr:hypothetical protein [Thermodesulfobacteriota bacterium]
QQKSGVRTWLAYKELIADYFMDDMEDEVITTSNWDNSTYYTVNQWGRDSNRKYSGAYSWSDSPDGSNYANNEDSGLVSTSIDLSGISSGKISFWHYRDFDGSGSDIGRVYISKDGGAWELIGGPYMNDSAWVQAEIEIGDLPCADVKIGFRFTSSPFIVGDGWYIDDVTVFSDFPVNEATLLVRVKEAASLSFDSGGTTAIEDGDMVTGQTSKAKGIVVGAPIISSGAWADGDAKGLITLNNVDLTLGTFQDNEALLVNEVALATVDTTVQGFRPRDNYIRVYYGDASGYGTPTSDPFDYEKHGNPRMTSSGDTVRWPPDEVTGWSADNDYFTLVRWDALIGSAPPELIPSLEEPDAVIRTDTLTTPSSGPFTADEIGLHTFGSGTYSTSVYFDDFAIQVEIPAATGFLPAIQQ